MREQELHQIAQENAALETQAINAAQDKIEQQELAIQAEQARIAAEQAAHALADQHQQLAQTLAEKNQQLAELENPQLPLPIEVEQQPERQAADETVQNAASSHEESFSSDTATAYQASSASTSTSTETALACIESKDNFELYLETANRSKSRWSNGTIALLLTTIIAIGIYWWWSQQVQNQPKTAEQKTLKATSTASKPQSRSNLGATSNANTKEHTNASSNLTNSDGQLFQPRLDKGFEQVGKHQNK